MNRLGPTGVRPLRMQGTRRAVVAIRRAQTQVKDEQQDDSEDDDACDACAAEVEDGREHQKRCFVGVQGRAFERAHLYRPPRQLQRAESARVHRPGAAARAPPAAVTA